MVTQFLTMLLLTVKLEYHMPQLRCMVALNLLRMQMTLMYRTL
nr:MAG TPA: hypothetical protein [Caudoviricetes sp.]